MSWLTKLDELHAELVFWSPPPIQVKQILRSRDILAWTKTLLEHSGQELAAEMVEALLQGRTPNGLAPSDKARVSNAYALLIDVEEKGKLLTGARLERWLRIWNRNLALDSPLCGGRSELRTVGEELDLDQLLARHQEEGLTSMAQQIHPVHNIAWFMVEFLRMAPFGEDSLVIGTASLNYFLWQKDYQELLLPSPADLGTQHQQLTPFDAGSERVLEVAESLGRVLTERLEARLALIKAHAGSGQCGVGGPRLLTIK